MKIFIVIPAHNEEAFLPLTLESLVNQSYLPEKIVVVNDNSTDGTEDILKMFTSEYPFISYININSSTSHQPGSKVVAAFNQGLNSLNKDYDIICKFDADLIFPSEYLETIADLFKNNAECGLAGGFCTIQKNGKWILENLTDKNHVRGALKAYRKSCFEQIGGLKESMGWDTVDELLAKYHDWQVQTLDTLLVKHLKPTGYKYDKAARLKQGQAFRKMRYGFWLSLIASAKLAMKKKSLSFFVHCIQGYTKNGKNYIVTIDEGKAIRKMRWQGVKKKLFF